MKFVTIDMASGSIRTGSVPQAYEGLGGRGLTSIMIDNEVPATCDPLGLENKLIIAPGFLSGTSLVNTSRLSIGAKSPLTGGIKESNVGGTVAADLAHLGITAIIVEGKPAHGGCHILKIDLAGNAELIDGTAYKGMRTYALVAKLKKTYGEKNSVTCIGPAGEFQLTAASIQTTDADGRPCRAAGRGGLGAVMGSKGLKAIIVAQGGKATDPLADPELFKAPAKRYAKAVKESSAELAQLGSAVLVAPINAVGAFPTCNAKFGQFEEIDKISGETMAEIIKQRGGKTTHKGCAQCIINCSNEYVDEDGKYVTSSLEYETIWSMGAMIGNADLDIIAKLDFLCDDIGLDTISTG
ncbi:MAG: aldehyde ferredoxin oxidoreductase, partial [Desulfobacterales bacterium]|nr:aldehyde ferredoxin oxidoreductase [Desulfobacterales bacterium]